MHLTVRAAIAVAMPILLLAGCSPDLSPNTYNSTAVQQANKVDQGVVVGVRQVDVKVSGQTGAVAGAAAGGVVGGSLPGSATGQALGTVGGGLLGGLLGSSVEQAAGDTKAWEYIVRKVKGGELVSVTQTGDPPLTIGQTVLVISGSQARIVPDYTVHVPDETADKAVKKTDASVSVAPLVPVVPTPADATPSSTAPADAAASPAPDAAAKPAPAAAIPSIPLPATLPSAAAAAATQMFAAPSAGSTTNDPALPVPVIMPATKPKE